MALLKGTLDVLVLKTLSWTAMHAFEIVSWLEQQSDGQLEITDAALLQALHRLEGRNLLSATWAATANNRRARYYKITAAGRANLRAETELLERQIDTLQRVLAVSSQRR
jgi:transcriptional regulator